jgi:hypothetical protein
MGSSISISRSSSSSNSSSRITGKALRAFGLHCIGLDFSMSLTVGFYHWRLPRPAFPLLFFFFNNCPHVKKEARFSQQNRGGKFA